MRDIKRKYESFDAHTEIYEEQQKKKKNVILNLVNLTNL